MSAAPMPVPPARRYVPALVEVSARRGVTVTVKRQPNLARWAVHTQDASGAPIVIAGPDGSQEQNPSNKELAAQIAAAVSSLGVEVGQVYCAEYETSNILKTKTDLPVTDLSPNPEAVAAAREGIEEVERRMVSGLVLACDASRGKGRNVNGCGWVLTYRTGADPVIGAYSKVADHGRIRAGELTAIRRGLQQAVNLHPVLRTGAGDLTVLSDSQNALDLIARYNTGEDCTAEDSEALKECGRIAGLTRGMKVNFQWVRGHAGHPLNELADRLAKLARRNHELGVDEVTHRSMVNAVREDAKTLLASPAV